MRRKLRSIVTVILGALLAAPQTLAIEAGIAALLAAPLLALALYDEAPAVRAVPVVGPGARTLGAPAPRRCQVGATTTEQRPAWLRPARVRSVRCGSLASYV